MLEQTFHLQQQHFGISQIRPPNLLDTVSRKRIKPKIANPVANGAAPLAGGHSTRGTLDWPGCRAQFGELGEQSRTGSARRGQRRIRIQRGGRDGAFPGCQGCADRPGEAAALVCSQQLCLGEGL